MDPNINESLLLLPSGPQLAALPLDSSLLLPPKPQPPANNASSAQPASSGPGTQTWAPDGEQAQGTVSSANDPTPAGATSGQSGETTQGGASESKGTSSATPPANTPAENPEL